MICDLMGRAVAVSLAFGVACSGRALAQEDFPFGRELLLDVRPMKGSKRVPSLEVQADGTAAVDLWCDSVESRIALSADAVVISFGEKTNRQCAQERAQADEALIDALRQVTKWRWDGETMLLTGGKELRFRLQTN